MNIEKYYVLKKKRTNISRNSYTKEILTSSVGDIIFNIASSNNSYFYASTKLYDDIDLHDYFLFTWTNIFNITPLEIQD